MSAKDTTLNSETETQRTTNRVWRRLCVAAIAGLIASQSIGCCFTGGCGAGGLASGFMDRQISCYRDKVWAKRAFNLRYGNCDRKFGDHFRNGFVDGYCSVCDGGDGFVPAMPPECYWGNEFQCAEGAQCVNSWFEGYPAGAIAARKDGAGSFRDVYISKMINSAIIQEKKQAELEPPRMAPVVPRDKTTLPPLVQPGQTQATVTPAYQTPMAEASSSLQLPMPMSTTMKPTAQRPVMNMPQVPMPMNSIQPANYENYVDGN